MGMGTKNAGRFAAREAQREHRDDMTNTREVGQRSGRDEGTNPEPLAETTSEPLETALDARCTSQRCATVPSQCANSHMEYISEEALKSTALDATFLDLNGNLTGQFACTIIPCIR